jgi:hypothetical protein
MAHVSCQNIALSFAASTRSRADDTTTLSYHMMRSGPLLGSCETFDRRRIGKGRYVPLLRLRSQVLARAGQTYARDDTMDNLPPGAKLDCSRAQREFPSFKTRTKLLATHAANPFQYKKQAKIDVVGGRYYIYCSKLTGRVEDLETKLSGSWGIQVPQMATLNLPFLFIMTESHVTTSASVSSKSRLCMKTDPSHELLHISLLPTPPYAALTSSACAARPSHPAVP